MTYENVNKLKANFDNAYTAPTPHLYLESMTRYGYEICDQARPYCAGALELLRETLDESCPIQMLDVGCSYGIGAVVVKYGRSFKEMTRFAMDEMPMSFEDAARAMREWLNGSRNAETIHCIGLDRSKPAIEFAKEAGLLEGGIARNLENPDCCLTEDDRRLIRRSNLMISTGAIGYLTETTLNKILPELGRDANGQVGPWSVVTILRMFDVGPIRASFEQHGFRFGQIPGVFLPQRRFADDEERRGVLEMLHQRGLDTRGYEDDGRHYANLYIATPPDQYHLLEQRLSQL